MTSQLSSASAELSKLARDLHRMGPATRRELRETFDRLGAPVLADARRRAGWSTRIPGAMSIRPIVDTGRGRVGIALRVDTEQAPHARSYEALSNQGSSGYFRHPVFGNLDVWRSQVTRPFAVPAVVAKGERARRLALDAVEKAVRECGFR